MTPGGSAGSDPGPGAPGDGPTAAARELAALLGERLRVSDLEADRALTVAELRRSLLPYPLCRERLSMASKAEYDVALLALLEDEELLEAEDELLEDVRKELASPEPGLGVLDEHAASSVRPGPGLGADAGGASRGPAGEAEAGAPPGAGRDETTARGVGREDEAPGAAPEAASGPGDAGAGASRASPGRGAGGGSPEAAREACGSCGTDLPGAEGVRFCPSCGADVTVPRCGDCGGELDAGWRYCPFCGSVRHA